MHSQKSHASLLALGIGLVALPSAAHAMIIASENFDSYALSSPPDNPLQGNNGGTGWTSAWTVVGSGGPGHVSTGATGFSGNYATLIGGGSFDQYRSFDAGANSTLWIAWKAAFTDPASNTGGGFGLFGLQTTGGTDIFLAGDSNGGGAAMRTNIIGNGDANHATLSANTVYRFAVEVTGIGAGAGNGSVSIYTFDEVGTLTPIRSLTGLTINSAGRIRMFGAYESRPLFDDIFVGTTQQSVIQASIIPEPAAFSSLLGVAALGSVLLRRRRRAE